MMSSGWVREKAVLAKVPLCKPGRRSCSACTDSVEECPRVLMGREKPGGNFARQAKMDGAMASRRVELRCQGATGWP